MESGLQWVVGRNGLYLDADLEYLDEYKKTGSIINSAGNGKCAYTSRQELAYAYAELILNDSLIGKIYNLCGESITQTQLAEILNEIFETKLQYKSVSVKDYLKDRRNAYGEFFGNVIGGIYECILTGTFNIPSDFEKITGHKHLSVKQMAEAFKLTLNENTKKLRHTSGVAK